MKKLELHSHPHTGIPTLLNAPFDTYVHTQAHRSRHSHQVLNFRTRFRLSHTHTHKPRQSMNRHKTFRNSAFLLKETTYHSKPYRRRQCVKKYKYFYKTNLSLKNKTNTNTQTPSPNTNRTTICFVFFNSDEGLKERKKRIHKHKHTNTHTWKQM